MNKYLSVIVLLTFSFSLSEGNWYKVSFGTKAGSPSVNGTAFVQMLGETHVSRGWEMAYTNGTILSKPSLVLPNQIYRSGVDSRIFMDRMRPTVQFQWLDKSLHQDDSTGIHVSNVTIVASYKRIPTRGCYYQKGVESPIKSGEQRNFYVGPCRD